jgi:hypothetical protein
MITNKDTTEEINRLLESHPTYIQSGKSFMSDNVINFIDVISDETYRTRISLINGPTEPLKGGRYTNYNHKKHQKHMNRHTLKK